MLQAKSTFGVIKFWYVCKSLSSIFKLKVEAGCKHNPKLKLVSRTESSQKLCPLNSFANIASIHDIVPSLTGYPTFQAEWTIQSHLDVFVF